MFITDLDRRAARELKLDKPWLYDPKPQQEIQSRRGRLPLMDFDDGRGKGN
jgi:hypothetical protein